jgi:predicted O-linked N-acetylglucosamine transferase (SPINDLY family)
VQQHYVEKIVYLPNCYQPNDSKRETSDKVFARAELGLPDTGFVFCCFNSSYKITPQTFDSWMRILSAVHGSFLLLVAENTTVKQNLKKEVRNRGVDPDRLIFADRLAFSDYLARYKSIDLFLNTFPYNAGTTASDALWMGLPVLTWSGETFVSRVTASLLNAIGLPELITESQECYEAAAIELATNPDTLAAIKAKLAENKFTTPLFDTMLFTRHIEEAFTQMMERYYADLAPDHIYVKSLS